MSRKIIFGLMLVGVAVVLWNEYRVWSEHSRRHYLKLHERRQWETSVAPVDGTFRDLMREAPDGEVHVIDLSFGPWQSSEPPFADTEEPARLRLGSNSGRAAEPATLPTMVLAKFESRVPTVGVPGYAFSIRGVWPWITIAAPIHDVTVPTHGDASALEPEALFVMPRPTSVDK